ncbi:MAG: T9SS type A sorting domain-containing protein [Bacteroidetes bacterium]|nr:MAG: T9SS type A sorting domain-containing protein [Bacteroidota bacterium]
MRLILTIFKNIFLIILFYSSVFSVDWDTKGNDFWLTFLPNYHMNKNNSDDRLKLGDSLFIFISSDEPATGTIEYVDLSGKQYKQNFSITEPAKFYIFKLMYLDYELLGYNDSGILSFRNNSETVKKQYFHIQSDKEVTVYAHNQAFKTSDACLVLPTDILGKNYFVMTYKSDGNYDIVSGNLRGNSTPSQFVVLGTEDNTLVIINPSSATQFNSANSQRIILNKGDSYLVQARIDSNELNNDLTGTEIQADKPVAVFAGHQRANIPVLSLNSPSRDCLYEEMPPTDSWGKNALLAPYQQPGNITKNGTDIFRILAAFDNTKISLNDFVIGQLNKGEYYEGELTGPGFVEASAPVLVAQFKKTSDYGAGTILGDPFEMLIPPVEQFMKSYRVLNIQAAEYSRDWFGQPIYQSVYTEQYITIVAGDSSISSVVMDGSPVSSGNFFSISSSGYSYANLKVGDGVHTIRCNDKIGVYVYGYGQADSYGYVGGMYLRTLDLQPPLVTGIDSCNSVIGAVFDTLITDSKLQKVDSPVGTQINVNVDIEKFTPYKDSVRFKASLIDNFKDGEFEIVAVDSFGLITTKKFTIRGFTLSFPDISPNNLKFEFDSTIIGYCNCDSIHIKNTGILPLILENNIFLKSNLIFSIPASQLPFILQPGDSKMLKICYCPVELTKKKQSDTLQMEYNCIKIKIPVSGISIPYSVIANSKIENDKSGCNVPVKISIIELPEMDYLGQIYPNPVSNKKAVFNFSIAYKSNVIIKVFDLYGNETKTIISDLLDKGVYDVNLDFTDFYPGFYFITLSTERIFLSKSIIVQN